MASKKHNTPIKKQNSTIIPVQLAGLLGVIAVITWMAYRSAIGNDYAYDDLAYVLENGVIRNFSWRAAWTEFILGNYHPLTAISLKIDHSIGELNPRNYHIHNIILHVLNTLLLGYYTFKLLKNERAALIAALLFGVHPLHTESVMWISERKDVLYTLFFLGGLITWIQYRETNKPVYYIYTILLFVLSCLSKGMAVVFPAVIWLTDYLLSPEKFLFKPKAWRIPQLIPFLILALGFGILAIYVQNKFGAVYHVKYLQMDYTVFHKILMVIHGYTFYLVKLVWPMGLCAYHPYPRIVDGALPWAYYIPPFYLMALGTLTWIMRKQKIFIYALLFYTLVLLPVLQILPVGENIVAERYAYLSTLGWFIFAGWGFSNLFEKFKIGNPGLIGIIIYAILLSWVTFNRGKDWKDNLTLFRDVTEKYPDNPPAHNNTGYGYEQIKQFDKAIFHYRKAISLDSNYADVYYNIGSIYGEDLAVYDSGIYYLRVALKKNPEKLEAYNNLGTFYFQLGLLDSAIINYRKVLDGRPNYSLGWYNLGCVYYRQSAFEKALQAYERSSQLDPSFPEVWTSLGNTYGSMGNGSKQIEAYKEGARRGSQPAQEVLRQQKIAW